MQIADRCYRSAAVVYYYTALTQTKQANLFMALPPMVQVTIFKGIREFQVFFSATFHEVTKIAKQDLHFKHKNCRPFELNLLFPIHLI